MAEEKAVPDKVAAWLVMWACLCSDVQVKRADLPKTCPGHGREQVAKPELLEALTQYVGVHQCSAASKCPQPKAADQ